MKKRIFKKLAIGLLPISLVIVPLASCSNNNTLNTGQNGSNNNDWNPNIGGSINDNRYNGTIDNKIIEFISKPVHVDIVDTRDKTTYDKLESISYFLNYNIDNNYINLVSEEGIKGDLYSFINSIFRDNKRAFSLKLNDEPTIKVSDVKTKSKEIKKQVSLSLSIDVINEENKNQTFKLLSNTYELISNSKYTLKISFENQIPSFSINSVNNRYFLGLKFNNVNFIFKDQKDKELGNFTLNNFTFTSNQFSYNFKKEFLYLTTDSDYKDVLSNKTVNDILKSKTDEQFKQELQQQFLNNQNQYKNVLVMINNLFKSISEKDSLESFISKNASGVLTLLSKFNVVNLSDNINKLITDLLNKDKSVVQVIQEDKQYILELIKDLVGNNQLILSVAENILDLVKPNLPEQEQKNIVDQINSLIGLIGNSNDKYLFVVDLVKSLLSGQNIYDFVKTALTKPDVKELINKLPENIKPLVNLLVKIIESGELSNNLINVIFKHKDELIKILNTLIPNETIKKVIDVLITKNTNFTEDNLNAIFSKVFYSLTQGLLNNFDNGKSEFKNFKFDKEKNEFTFDFSTTYQITKEFKWELKPIVDLLPNKLNLKDFGLNTNEIEKKVKEVGKGLLNLNNDKGKEWYIFDKKDIFGFIPPHIDFTIGDSIVFTNTAKDQQIWLNPQNIGSKDFFGYSVPTVSGFRLNLPGGVKSIVSQYKSTDNYFGFTKLFIEFLTQQHNFYQNVSVIDNKNEITDGLVYNNDLYINNIPYDWKITLNKEFKNKVKTNSKKDVLTEYKVKTSNNVEVVLNSYNLTNNLTQEQLGEELIKDYDTVFKNSQYKPFIMLNQISDFTDQTTIIPLSVKILIGIATKFNINVNVTNFTFMVSSYLPFKTYNNKKEFVDYLYSQTGSYLKAGISYSTLVNETFYNDWIV